jgi:hypothetical protein
MRLPLSICLVLLLCLCGSLAYAQQTFFEPTTRARLSASATINISKFSTYRLREGELRAYLLKAPVEFNGQRATLRLEIPLPDGTTEPFAMVESAILAPAIAAQHPDIKTYAGQGLVHSDFSIRLSFTSSGFEAIILGVGGDAVYYTKASADPANALYLTYFARDVQKPAQTRSFGTLGGGKCGAVSPLWQQTPATQKGARKQATANNTGTTLRTFRLAIAVTGEFTARAPYSGNVTAAFDGMVGYVNRMNAVYRRELAVAFTLVSGQSLVYANAATDPYTNTNQITMLDENQTNLDNVLGNANYDVGHVLSFAGGSGGGIASNPSICANNFKGRGVSGVGDGSFAPVFDDQLLSHEVGHQFGMSHSYNSVIPVCTTREPATSVEPGAGTTIMSYGYTCENNSAADGPVGNDNYEDTYQPILNFHVANYFQAVTTIASVGCYTSPAVANAVPVVSTFPAAATIPKSTPFALTGAATDTDAGDALTYSWEGGDTGAEELDANTLANTAKPPFFRSYAPVSTGTRYFPRLSAVLDGSNYAKGDKLPSIGTPLNLAMIVRDNNTGLTYRELTLTVDGNSGPFLITNDPTGTVTGNSVQNVTWSVNNTNAAPVNCTNVDILLSTDGGQTFPTTLLANAPNNGSASVTLPNTTTTQARIKVAARGNVFFDISNTNFGITAVTPVELVYFRAEPAVNQVRLSWATANEQNSERFTVERGRDLSEFGAIGSVAAAGESVQLLSYGLNDEQPMPGTSYYRLVQRDRDGRTQISKPVSVVLDASAPSLLVWPNPASGSQLRYRLLNLTAPALSLVTMSGSSVAIQSVTEEGSGNYVLKSAVRLPAGVYILRASSDSVQLTQRVLIVD